MVLRAGLAGRPEECGRPPTALGACIPGKPARVRPELKIRNSGKSVTTRFSKHKFMKKKAFEKTENEPKWNVQKNNTGSPCPVSQEFYKPLF
jgi:hypothetical protein